MVQACACIGRLKVKRGKVLGISLEIPEKKGKAFHSREAHTEMRDGTFGIPHY